MPNTDTTYKADKIEFIEYHQPPLDSGNYEITVEHEFHPGEGVERKYTKNLKFSVVGHRYDPLTSFHIYGVFPPEKSLGYHSHVLPHITLLRSTLPWERSCDDNDLNLPWLALLVFWDEEKPEPQTVTLEQLKDIAGYSAQFPEWSGEVGEQDLDEILVIDVPKSLVEKIMPRREDLPYLGHVRKAKFDEEQKQEIKEDIKEKIPEKAEAIATRLKERKEGEGDPTEIEIPNLDPLRQREMATVIANRLPKPNGRTTVHLVSVENRFLENGEFHYQDAKDDNDLIRFVSLKSWSFACVAQDQTFTELLLNLDRDPNSFRLPPVETPNAAAAENYLSQGYLPLNHGLRQGGKTVSWYHGPFSPGKNPAKLEEAVLAADALVRYDSSNGLFDTSYAAAWELGRLLTLSNQSLAVEIYNWKRARSHALQKLEDRVLHLPFRRRLVTLKRRIPKAIASWFQDLELLKGIPFNYLVPDERLLPDESIRFFWVDSYWVDCLQDGAFSIGRVIPTDAEKDTGTRREFPTDFRPTDETITGILLRSEVVYGWPGLLVDGYGSSISDSEPLVTSEKPLRLLRMERLSKNVLICLFAGEVKTVDIHLRPESMHFGVDPFGTSDTNCTKGLRDPEGNETNIQIDSVPCRNFKEGVINIEEFAKAIKEILPHRGAGSDFTSAQFGLEMIEGVPKVRFNKEI